MGDANTDSPGTVIEVNSVKADYVCPQCFDLFSQPVWHCRRCDHHWSFDDDECRNCHDPRDQVIDLLVEQIVVEGRYRKELGDIPALADSIAGIGLLHPIVVKAPIYDRSEDYEDLHLYPLVVGERRLEAVKHLGWQTIPAYVMPALEDVLRAEHDENVFRQDFRPSEKVAIAGALMEGETEAAKERQLATLKQNQSEDRSEKFSERGDEGRAKAKVASVVGVSRPTLDKMTAVVKAAEDDPALQPLVEEMDDSGKVDRAYRRLKARQRDEALAENKMLMPEGVFDVLLADPPWRYDFSETGNRDIENHYPTMSLEEIKALEVPAAEDAVLFLWATAPKLEEALAVMKSWGFSYKTHAVWDKEHMGMGYWFRGQHELLLVGTRGGFSPPDEGLRVSSVIREARSKHSRKPEAVYNLLEGMLPHGRYLELFSRQQRDGWAAWGAEADLPEPT